MPPSPTSPRPSITLTEDGKDQGDLIDDTQLYIGDTQWFIDDTQWYIDDTQWYIDDTQWYIVHKIDNRNDNILIDDIR